MIVSEEESSADIAPPSSEAEQFMKMQLVREADPSSIESAPPSLLLMLVKLQFVKRQFLTSIWYENSVLE